MVRWHKRAQRWMLILGGAALGTMGLSLHPGRAQPEKPEEAADKAIKSLSLGGQTVRMVLNLEFHIGHYSQVASQKLPVGGQPFELVTIRGNSPSSVAIISDRKIFTTQDGDLKTEGDVTVMWPNGFRLPGAREGNELRMKRVRVQLTNDGPNGNSQLVVEPLPN